MVVCGEGVDGLGAMGGGEGVDGLGAMGGGEGVDGLGAPGGGEGVDGFSATGGGEGVDGLGAMGGLGFCAALDTVTGGGGLAGILELQRRFSIGAGLDVSTGEETTEVLKSDVVALLVDLLDEVEVRARRFGACGLGKGFESLLTKVLLGCVCRGALAAAGDPSSLDDTEEGEVAGLSSELSLMGPSVALGTEFSSSDILTGASDAEDCCGC